jgi:SAM-dependent methyltransferase
MPASEPIPSNDTPTVSIVMPVFNGARYLRAAVNSILEQTWADFEFIVVDDGSTDETSAILKSYSDERLHVHRIEHAGLIPALNTGVARCHGRYLARMDADDISYPDRIEREVAWLEAHADCDLVTCRADQIDSAGRIVGQHPAFDPRDMLLELAAGNPIVHGSVMLRRSALPPGPLYGERPEDYRLWVQLARAGKRFDCIDHLLYAFREHPERYSLTHADSQSTGIVAVQRPLLQDLARRNPRDERVRARLIRGWGTLAGAAHRSGDHTVANDAYDRFRQLARGRWSGDVAAAVHHAIDAMIWGGCPWARSLRLRAIECRRAPSSRLVWRNLLLCLPLVQSLRAKRRRDAESLSSSQLTAGSTAPTRDGDAFERLDLDKPVTDAVQVRLHVARYEFAAGMVRDARVLDVACGTGYGTALLADAAAHEVVGIDCDAATVERARSRFARPNARFMTGNAEQLPLDGPFDVAVSFETVEHLSRPGRFLDEVRRVLVPGGTFIVSTPCRRDGTISDRPANPYHVREWNVAEFHDLLGSYFDQVTMYAQGVEFAKNRLPFNRTLARWLIRVTAPDRLRNLYSHDVRRLEPPPWFRCRIAYLVAVCRSP